MEITTIENSLNNSNVMDRIRLINSLNILISQYSPDMMSLFIEYLKPYEGEKLEHVQVKSLDSNRWFKFSEFWRIFYIYKGKTENRDISSLTSVSDLMDLCREYLNCSNHIFYFSYNLGQIGFMHLDPTTICMDKQ